MGAFLQMPRGREGQVDTQLHPCLHSVHLIKKSAALVIRGGSGYAANQIWLMAHYHRLATACRLIWLSIFNTKMSLIMHKKMITTCTQVGFNSIVHVNPLLFVFCAYFSLFPTYPSPSNGR